MDEEVIIYEGKKKNLRQVKPRSMERGLPGLHFFFFLIFLSRKIV